MMKSQIAIVVAASLLILGTIVYILFTRDLPPEHAFPAVVQRDCAPWDGAAFTVSIPVESRMIQISVWKSPEIKLPVAYSFPDDTGTVGSAFLLSAAGIQEELSGRVTFRSVTQENPVEGRFDLLSETGRKYTGKFTAAWKNKTVLCG